MSGKVTMQDIADALGLSRNTVSKAINNNGVISDTTKNMVLKKAAEMGYRNLSGIENQNAILKSGQNKTNNMSAKKEIAMLTSSMPGGSHFAVTTLDRMQQIFSYHGYSLTFYRVTPEELSNLRLPGSLFLRNVSAIFCMELFNYEYCRMLSELRIPLLLIDGPAYPDRSPLPVDLLLMENQAGIFNFISHLAEKGKKSVGFVGNMMHCRSFFERGCACITAASINGLSSVRQYSIDLFSSDLRRGKIPDYMNYADNLYHMLREMKEMPDAFICANDYIAINLISALRRMDIRCPDDVLVMGFDDSPESRFHTPSLTTVHIHTQIMGNLAAELILSRIAEPDREPRTTYALTELIERESTNC